MGTAAADPRARDLGIPFPGTPGPLNTITDVAGVEVGYTTLIAGDGNVGRHKDRVSHIQVLGIQPDQAQRVEVGRVRG